MLALIITQLYGKAALPLNPVAASDWRKELFGELLGLADTRLSRNGDEKRLERYGTEKTSTKIISAAVSRENLYFPGCCFTVVLRPVAMTQSDCCTGDYNMTSWPIHCLIRHDLYLGCKVVHS